MTHALQLDRSACEIADLRTGEEYLAITQEWWQLWERSPIRTPFESPAWILEWLRCFGTGFNSHIFTLRFEKKLVGLLPLLCRNGDNMLALVGAGISDYLGACFDPDYPTVPCELLTGLAASFDTPCQLDLHHLHSESALLRVQSPRWVAADPEPEDCSPVAPLPADMESFYARVAPKARENLRYNQRRIQREFDVRIESALAENLGELLDCFFALHTRRWNHRAAPGVLADPELQDFHHGVAARFLRHGILRLFLLRLDNRPAAAFYGFRCGHTTFFYLSGFDPEFEKFSPGSLLIHHAIANAIEEKCTRFDFLRGCESYKYLWTAQDTSTFHRVMVCREAV